MFYYFIICPIIVRVSERGLEAVLWANIRLKRTSQSLPFLHWLIGGSVPWSSHRVTYQLLRIVAGQNVPRPKIVREDATTQRRVLLRCAVLVFDLPDNTTQLPLNSASLVLKLHRSSLYRRPNLKPLPLLNYSPANTLVIIFYCLVIISRWCRSIKCECSGGRSVEHGT